MRDMSYMGLPKTIVALLALVVVELVYTGVAYSQILDPALIEARRQKSHPSFSLLSFRHIDELFDAREVSAGIDVWELEYSDIRLEDDALIQFSDGEKPLSLALSEMRTNALLVIHDGKIVREIHRNGGGTASRYMGYSMSKSWTSILVGVALEQGAINSLEDPITKYLPELIGTAFEGVTLHSLLQMQAGTSWSENYGPGSLLDKYRDGATNIAQIYYEDAAFEVERVAEPGTIFNYSTLSTGLVGQALERATGQTLSSFMSENLWKPAGMEAPGYWMLQGPADAQREWSGAGFGGTVRDFGRLGLMMLNNGMANGRQVVPVDWVKMSTHPEDNPNYFYFWWAIPGIDGFSARGFGGQAVMVDRASNTVMVLARFTTGDETEGGDPNELFKSIIQHLQRSQ